MSFVGSSLHLFLLLSLASTLFSKFLSPLFLFAFFSTIVLVVIVGNYRPPGGGEADWVWPSSLIPIYEDSEDGYSSKFDDDDNGNDVKDNSDSDDEDEKNGGSDGYDEEDDDEGSDGEIGWDDDEQIDDNLEIRIEAFISKVTKGWREEWLKDNGYAQMRFG